MTSQAFQKSMVLVPIGGLCNRIFAISSAIALCRENQWRLKVVWFKDWGMGADFHKLLRLSESIDHVQIIDARPMDYRYDRPRKRNLWLTYPWQRLRFDFRVYFETDYATATAEDLIQRLISAPNNIYNTLSTVLHNAQFLVRFETANQHTNQN